jgi:VanZ family protein
MRHVDRFTSAGRMAIRKMFKIAAWLLLFSIVALSVVPPSDRIVTIFPQPIEHFAIFLLTGLAFGLAYPGRHPGPIVPLLLFTAAVELLQLWIPGRHARLSDFVVNLLGLGAGFGLLYIVTRWRKAAGMRRKHERGYS